MDVLLKLSLWVLGAIFHWKLQNASQHDSSAGQEAGDLSPSSCVLSDEIFFLKVISKVAQSCPTLCDPNGLQPTRLLCPWNFPGTSTGVDCHFLLQGIFPTQGSNPGLPHCRQTLYHLSHQGSQSQFIFMELVRTPDQKMKRCTVHGLDGT